MFNFKKNIFISFSFLFTLLILTAIITFLIDPLQHYRKAAYYKVYTFEQRYLAWGLLKNYEYDSVLIGTSMTENFRTNNVNKDLDLNILRVPFPGASAYEENLLIQKALENKKLSTVVYGLDFFSFRGDKQRIKYGENSLPAYLMNDTMIDDFKYLLNIDIFFQDNIKIFLSNFMGIRKDLLDFNRFWSWDSKYTFSKELCIKSYHERLKLKDNYKIDELKKSFDYNMLTNFKKNKDKEFIIFFPPYSILAWKAWENKKHLYDILDFKEYILRQSFKYKNVKIYDFQIAKNITHNLNNYFDVSHYSAEINNWMTQQIKNDNYLVRKENIDEYLESLKLQISSFDTDKI